jgi:hypothetical protein
LGLVAQPKPDQVVVYGSADPLPNPAELMLTQLVAHRLGIGWRFFVHRHGKNLVLDVPENCVNPPGVFYFENIIPEDINLRALAEEVWRFREEPVVIAHRPDGRSIRASKKVKDVPDVTISQLHAKGGWPGGSAIHFLLRRYAEKHPEVLYICPFQQKGRVYEIYKGVGRGLFILTPFVRIAPPSEEAPGGWEPLSWKRWRSLPAAARRLARSWIKQELKNFFRWGGPPRIEIPWGWWSFR